MLFEQIITPGLGCFSYIVGCHETAVAAVFDPRRDVGVYLRVAEDHGLRITHIFDTHIHADHVSGARELRLLTGADIYIHENAAVGYEAIKIKRGDEFKIGSATVRVLHTPGHTPESVSFLITDSARSPEPEMILTGDLLFVGDVGRPDLPGEKIRDEQTQSLFNSLYKTLEPLPDYLEIYPAHGAGSLCGGNMSAKPVSTLGYERLANPMLKFSDFTGFKRAVLSNLPMRPLSFSGIIRQNTAGLGAPKELGVEECDLSPEKAAEFLKAGATLLDLRDARSFGAAHIPGSVNVDFSGGPALNWVGAAIPPGTPLVLILPAGADFEKIRTELRRIGYDDIKGRLKGGLEAWRDEGRETRILPHISSSELLAKLAGKNPPVLTDVRSPEEFEKERAESSVNLPFDRIAQGGACPFAPDTEVVIICRSGFRAGIAASLLQAAGCTGVSILSGGLSEWPQPRDTAVARAGRKSPKPVQKD